MRRSIAYSLCSCLATAILPVVAWAQLPDSGFADASRSTKLRAAFPAIDQTMRDFVARETSLALRGGSSSTARLPFIDPLAESFDAQDHPSEERRFITLGAS